jgi:hypothetical protein
MHLLAVHCNNFGRYLGPQMWDIKVILKLKEYFFYIIIMNWSLWILFVYLTCHMECVHLGRNLRECYMPQCSNMERPHKQELANVGLPERQI